MLHLCMTKSPNLTFHRKSQSCLQMALWCNSGVARRSYSVPSPRISSHLVLSAQVSLLSYPSLIPISESIHTEKEIYDVTFSPHQVCP